MQSWNLHEVAVQFDGRRTPHKTAKFSGDRYCIVLYNPDLSYHNKGFTHIHERTEQLRPPTNEAPKEVGRVVTDSQKSARRELSRQLHNAKWVTYQGAKSHSKYAGAPSTTLCFGTARRLGPYKNKCKGKPAVANKTHKPLYRALRLYLRALLGATVDDYAGVFVARNSVCDWHYDATNVGPSIITCVGEYEGGDLLINPSKYRPLICYKCKKGDPGARVCREVLKHTAEEWWCDIDAYRAL